MKDTKNKASAIAIVMLLIVSMISMFTIQITSAHSPSTQVPTYAFINVSPSPAGLGQSVTLNFWLQIPPPTALVQYGDRWGNFTVKVTKPDGIAETLGPFTSDDTGGTYTIYTPTQLGNYSFVFSFLGQTLAGNNLGPGQTNVWIGDYFMPSTSSAVTLTVQQDPIPDLPINPLPTDYWTRPVQSTNSLWYQLTGSWLGLGQTSFGNSGQYNSSTNYNPYTSSPKTPHILWTKSVAFGGLLGGEFGDSLSSNYYSTAQYEPKFAPIILNGVLYYEQYPGASTNPVGWIAVDLRTGQTLWTYNTTQVLRCGQLLDYTAPNQFGALAYLWATGPPPSGIQGAAGNTFTGTTYNMYDAMTGSYVLSIINGTSLMLTEDSNGNLIGYYVNASTANVYNAPTLNMWNSTRAVEKYGVTTGQNTNIWEWRPPQNTFIQFSSGIMWSKPIATNISGVPIPLLSFFSSAVNNGYVSSGVVHLAAVPATGLPYNYQAGQQIEAGYDANTGDQLWIVNRTYAPATRLQLLGSGDGVYVYVELSTATLYGYSLKTGAKLWTTTIPNANAWNGIGDYMAVPANGTLYTWGFGGDILAMDMLTGKILWQTSTTVISGDPGTSTPYGVWPLWTFTVGTVADGVLYIPEGHQYSPPIFRGAHQLAINITNGQLVWDIMGFDTTTAPAIADGIMTTLNSYDNQIYAYGKGPSKTTVTVPSVGITASSTPITISGTVTDISASSEQLEVSANYPNGLPCVSDASMSDFMESVYMQQPMPHNITGVPVTISVLDSNGNYRSIGVTTSDNSGTFAYTWTPDISGDYTVYATFAGSESYYSSNALAHFHASEPAATPTPQPTQAQSMADQYFLPATVGLFVLIIIVLVMLAIVMMRKRP